MALFIDNSLLIVFFLFINSYKSFSWLLLVKNVSKKQLFSQEAKKICTIFEGLAPCLSEFKYILK